MGLIVKLNDDDIFLTSFFFHFRFELFLSSILLVTASLLL